VKLRVAIVGLGTMGLHHARVLSSLDGVELKGYFDIHEKNSKLALKRFDSVENLIQAGVDYCVVSVPTKYHEEISVKLINSGIHLLVEKPIAHNIQSANRILQAAEHMQTHIGIGHIERFNAALIEAKRRIKLNELGNILSLTTRRVGPFPARIDDVGVVKDLATHDIDLTSWLTDSNYKYVSAMTARRSGREHEDITTIMGELSSGVIATHHVNWLSPKKEREIQILGTRGLFQVDTLHSTLAYFENGSVDISESSIAQFYGVTQGNVISYAFDKPEALHSEHVAFRDFLLGKKSQIVTIHEGIEVLRIAELALESANIGSSAK
jgi:predicted dehydrogenase